MKNRLLALSVAIPVAMLAAMVCVSSAQAQRHGSLSARGSRIQTAVSRGGGGARTSSLPRRRTRGVFVGSAFAPFYSDYDDYDNYDYEPEIETPPPQIVAARAAQPTSPAPAPKPPEPLVLELQGDHWVRITPYGPPQIVGASEQQAPERASNVPPTTSRRTQAAQPGSTVLPPAVLVFRDGHQEEIGRYTIMGATIYISTDYWTSGSWTRKVQIAELDVPTTLRLNQERGANFKLPSGPDEVMVRP